MGVSGETLRIPRRLPEAPSPIGRVSPPGVGWPAGRRRRKRVAIWSFWSFLGVAVVLFVFAVVLAVQVMMVRSDLADVRPKIDPIREAVLDGDTVAATSAFAEVSAAAEAARSHSGGPVWWLGSKLPVVGSSLGTVRDLVLAVDDLVDGPLTTVIDLGDRLDPDTLLTDGAVDIGTLEAVRGPVTTASAEATAVLAGVKATPDTGLLGPVAEARAELLDKLAELDGSLAGAATAAQVAPAMLGADGPRTYLMAFQNNAEIKGTGGLIGTYGVLTAVDGKIKLAHIGSNDELKNFKPGVVDLGPEFNANYGVLFPTFLWSNANSSPHFPYAGQIWATMYERQFGTHIDGVIAADPAALAHILRATGPVRVSTGTADGDSVERLLQVDAYEHFDGDRAERKGFLAEVAEAAFGAALNGTGGPQELLTQLSDAADGGHLQFWSPVEAEMDAMRKAHATGEMYQGPAPYAGVVLNNVSGAKLDYYLDRDITYTLANPAGGRRDGRIDITLTNTAPGGLPTFVTDRIDARRGTYPVGQSRLQLTVYATEGASITGVTVNGAPVEHTTGTELGHPRVTMWVYPTPGQPLAVSVTTDEPTRPEAPIVPEQPMGPAPGGQVEVIAGVPPASTARGRWDGM